MLKLLMVVAVLFSGCVGSLPQQTTAPQYRIGVDLFGGHKPFCPIFIGHVYKDTPAAEAGLKPGDQLIAIDGAEIKNLNSAAQRLTSGEQKPVTLTLRRHERPLTVVVQREDSAILLRKSGWKILPDGTLAKSDATDAEIKYLVGEIAFAESPAEIQDRSVAFPEQHYPVNKELYYPGFEVFLFDKGDHIIVGGIDDGPASRAGIRWGDRIVAINSVDPRGKSAAEIESMLSSNEPASISLTISRGEAPKTFTFPLAQASTVLRENRWRVVNGELVPLWSPDKYLPCWE